jgi:fibronectin type 3 domain-containing protein
MRNLKHLFVVIAALLMFAGACGNEGGDGLPTVDTVAPVPPTGVQLQADHDLVAVRWDENAEIDLAGYRLYKSSFEDGPFGIVSSNLVYCPWFYDKVLAMEMTYYKVTAVDASGNESAFSQIVGIYYNTDRKTQPDAPSE